MSIKEIKISQCKTCLSCQFYCWDEYHNTCFLYDLREEMPEGVNTWTTVKPPFCKIKSIFIEEDTEDEFITKYRNVLSSFFNVKDTNEISIFDLEKQIKSGMLAKEDVLKYYKNWPEGIEYISKL